MVREALTLEQLSAMPADAAAALFTARKAEGLTQDEEVYLANWLAADPGHVRALELAERSWDAFNDAEGDEILTAMRQHALAARNRPALRWRPRAAVAAVAAVLLLIAGTSLWLAAPQIGPNTSQQIAWTRYEAPLDQVRDFKLADGSVMTLDAGSVVNVRLGSSDRALQLMAGRALFEVSHDPSRPFTVAAAHHRVTALGTRFEVDLGGDSLKVTLLRGRVAVQPTDSDAKGVELSPGEQFVDRDGVTSVGKVDAPDTPGWSQGLLAFDDMRLGEAIIEINRYSREKIVIHDTEITMLRVSGQFRAGEAMRFASTVAELHHLRMVRHNNEIELRRK